MQIACFVKHLRVTFLNIILCAIQTCIHDDNDDDDYITENGDDDDDDDDDDNM